MNSLTKEQKEAVRDSLRGMWESIFADGHAKGMSKPERDASRKRHEAILRKIAKETSMPFPNEVTVYSLEKFTQEYNASLVDGKIVCRF